VPVLRERERKRNHVEIEEGQRAELEDRQKQCLLLQ
jgi:hypothetical protein